MSIDTNGKIKGFVKHEDILQFIKQNWDPHATSKIDKNIYGSISEYGGDVTINKHSEDNEKWYVICGFIYFAYKGEKRMLFYHYSNLNHHENLDYYAKYGLEDMVKAETTHLSLGFWGNSVELIKELVVSFGGGWLDEDDCDGEPYYPV